MTIEEQIMEIADNRATEFLRWVDKNYYQNHCKNNCFAKAEEDFHSGETFTYKQLLEIYKKQL